jgi:transposase InsO family protein
MKESTTRSIGGKWYVLVIVDDYSRYSWVFFLESKDQVFEHFCLLALRLNNEHPNCLKAIRSDNETEFRNVSFDGFCHEHGIDQQFPAPRVPQQNRVVERKNRTLVENFERNQVWTLVVPPRDVNAIGTKWVPSCIRPSTRMT